VHGSFDVAVMPAAGEAGTLVHALGEADLVLTAVGTRALPDVVRRIAPVLAARSRPAWILFCENGRRLAAVHGPAFTAALTPADTVMSRMCRFAEPAERRYAPILPGRGEMLVTEAYDMIPLDRARCAGGPFTSVFSLVDSAEFALWEDVKLFLHNGLHAFVAYHAFLEGTERFPEVPPPILSEARRVMVEEIVPAILAHHPTAVREKLENYGQGLLARFVDPGLDDRIERGIRGVKDKLAPGERLLGGLDYIREAGIEPRLYGTAIEAARRIQAIRTPSNAPGRRGQ